jgi:hypothetical protein
MSETIEVNLSNEEQAMLVNLYIEQKTSDITKEHIRQTYRELTPDNLREVCFALVLNEQINQVVEFAINDKEFITTMEENTGC